MSPSFRALHPRGRSAALLAAASVAVAHPALAATCPAGGLATATTSTQTVANGVTCTVTSTGSVTVASGSTAAVTLTSNGGLTTLNNSGTVQETGTATGRAVQTAGTNQAIAISNALGATLYTINNDTVAVGTGSGNTVTSAMLTNAGTIRSDAGGQAVNFNKIQSGTNAIVNSGLIQATLSDAVRPGVNGTVTNTGTILSIAGSDGSATTSDGIDAQTNSGISITNAGNFSGSTPGTGTIEGARHGITGGMTTGSGAFAMTVTNNLGGTIKGDNGAGINIDGLNANELVTITNHGTITGNGVSRDGDGVDVDGLVALVNTGTIRSLDAHGTSGIEYSEGVTVGGGTITNSGTIQGSVSAGNATAVGRGITIAGIDTSGAPAAPYAATTITNSGLIRGDSDSAIVFSSALASGFSHTISNQAGGVIQTGSSSAAAILTAADAVTITNAGRIDGAASGVAVKGGSGNLTIRVTGNAAAILGDLQGGSAAANTLTLDPGSGNSFAYAGSISNFSAVESHSGHTTLSGVSTYTGTTTVSGGTLTLDGANRLAAGSSLILSSGTLQLADAGGANGQSFASLALLDSSGISLGSSSLTFSALGAVTAGKSLSVIDWSSNSSPAYAFRLAGDLTQNAGLLGLLANTTIDGLAASAFFDGAYTDVRPVPLPGAALLFLSGLGALTSMRRRRVCA